jgi:hypothetical protein
MYRKGLLADTPASRERYFRETFWSLGHLVHFVQDAASPAHTRDDDHLPGDEDGLHVWATRGAIDAIVGSSVPVSFSGNLVSATSEADAPRPVARIIDATEGNRGAPAWTSDIGLAEYSNSQFLSDDRGFSYPLLSGYTYPRLAEMQRIDAGPSLTVPSARRYYLKFPAGSQEGESDYHVAAELPLVVAAPNSWFYEVYLTHEVLEGYAEELLPRAVGYSATAIDHFFRGRIAVTSPDDAPYARAEWVEGNAGSFEKLRLMVSNDSPSGHETSGQGDLWVVVHYRTSGSNLFETPGASISADPIYMVKGPEPVTLTRTPQEVTFDLASGELPTNMADVWLTVVYQGALGGEPDAVLVGAEDLPEPYPVDYANLTDYDCVNGSPYYVGDLAPNDPDRDIDGDGSLDLIGPARAIDEYRLATDVQYTPFPYPTPSGHDFYVAESKVMDGFTPTSRYVVLHGGNNLWRSFLVGEFRDEHDTLVHQSYTNGYGTYTINRNDYDRSQNGLARRAKEFGSYRGVVGLSMIYWHARTTPYFEAHCLYPLAGAPPDLTRIPGTVAP